MKSQLLELNIVPGGVPPIVQAAQYDVGRTIQVKLQDGINTLGVDSDTQYIVVGTKPSGKRFRKKNIVTVNNDSLEFDLTASMTPVYGDVFCGIIMVNGETRIGSLLFTIHLQKAPFDEDIPDVDDIDP